MAVEVEETAQRPSTQTVDRALAILSAFTATEPELSSSDLAARLDLHPTTAYRLLSTLAAGGFVVRDERSGLYRLGLRLVELAGLVLNQMDMYRHALPELDLLRDRLSMHANLAVLDDGDVVHLAYATRPDVPRFYTALGRRSVAHCTALGKVLLAAEPRDRVHATIERRGWRPYTERSIEDFDTLDRCLDEVAAQGYAVDEGARRLGVSCVAAPVRDRSGAVVGAISVSGADEEAEAHSRDCLVREVVEAARRISGRLGHTESFWP